MCVLPFEASIRAGPRVGQDSHRLPWSLLGPNFLGPLKKYLAYSPGEKMSEPYTHWAAGRHALIVGNGVCDTVEFKSSQRACPYVKNSGTQFKALNLHYIRLYNHKWRIHLYWCRQNYCHNCEYFLNIHQCLLKIVRKGYFLSNSLFYKYFRRISVKQTSKSLVPLVYVPLQKVPFPMYPVSQLQTKDPSVLLQVALSWQLSREREHSSISKNTQQYIHHL